MRQALAKREGRPAQHIRPICLQVVCQFGPEYVMAAAATPVDHFAGQCPFLEGGKEGVWCPSFA
jgi:hypothetical protein